MTVECPNPVVKTIALRAYSGWSVRKYQNGMFDATNGSALTMGCDTFQDAVAAVKADRTMPVETPRAAKTLMAARVDAAILNSVMDTDARKVEATYWDTLAKVAADTDPEMAEHRLVAGEIMDDIAAKYPAHFTYDMIRECEAEASWEAEEIAREEAEAIAEERYERHYFG